jgi:hypothetical protein
MKKSFFPLFLFLLTGVAVYGQAGARADASGSLLSLALAPTVSMPLGADAEVFGYGAGGDILVRYRMPFFRPFSLGGVLSYEYTTLQMASTLSTLAGGIEASLLWEPVPWLGLRAYGRGGYFYSLLNGGGNGGGNPYASAGIEAELRLFPQISVAAGAGYRQLFGFSSSLAAGLDVAYHFNPPVSIEEQLKLIPKPLKGVGLEGIHFSDVFPVFFKYYDTHPIGGATLVNGEGSAIE